MCSSKLCIGLHKVQSYEAAPADRLLAKEQASAARKSKAWVGPQNCKKDWDIPTMEQLMH